MALVHRQPVTNQAIRRHFKRISCLHLIPLLKKLFIFFFHSVVHVVLFNIFTFAFISVTRQPLLKWHQNKAASCFALEIVYAIQMCLTISQ